MVALEVKIVEAPPMLPELTRKKAKAYTSKAEKIKNLLSESPSSVAVIGSRPGKKVDPDLADDVKRNRALSSAKLLANQINAGHVSKWPSDTYYAAIRMAPVDSDAMFQVVVGLQSHRPAEWDEFVLSAENRKRKHDEAPDADVVSDDPFQDDADA